MGAAGAASAGASPALIHFLLEIYERDLAAGSMRINALAAAALGRVSPPVGRLWEAGGPQSGIFRGSVDRSGKASFLEVERDCGFGLKGSLTARAVF
jgi:hypothetical protein